MKRRLFTILSALSLLLFVAVVALWVRSYMLSDRISDCTLIGSSSLATAEVQSGLGVLGVQLYMHSYAPTIVDELRASFAANPRPLQLHHRKPWPQRPNFGRMNGGYKWGPVEFASSRSGHIASVGVCVVLPYLAWACVATLPSVPWLLHRWRRRRRLRSNACPSCGYDLRATPEQCPECGEPVPSAGVQRGA